MTDAEPVREVPVPKQVDYDDPKRNMFGLLPCPKCGDTHRWPTQPVHPKHPDCILCDDCGLVEPIVKEAP